jgi:hypothetical protein
VFTNARIKFEIIDYITVEQLYIKGEDGLGDKLKQYSPFTISEKERKGDPFDRTTLNDSGKFYASFKVLINNGEVRVYANDLHDLTDRYGENILTLSDEGIEKITPKIIEIARRYVIETILTK